VPITDKMVFLCMSCGRQIDKRKNIAIA